METSEAFRLERRDRRGRGVLIHVHLCLACTPLVKVSKSGDKIEGIEMFRSWRLGAPPSEGPAGTSHK